GGNVAMAGFLGTGRAGAACGAGTSQFCEEADFSAGDTARKPGGGRIGDGTVCRRGIFGCSAGDSRERSTVGIVAAGIVDSAVAFHPGSVLVPGRARCVRARSWPDHGLSSDPVVLHNAHLLFGSESARESAVHPAQESDVRAGAWISRHSARRPFSRAVAPGEIMDGRAGRVFS